MKDQQLNMHDAQQHDVTHQEYSHTQLSLRSVEGYGSITDMSIVLPLKCLL